MTHELYRDLCESALQCVDVYKMPSKDSNPGAGVFTNKMVPWVELRWVGDIDGTVSTIETHVARAYSCKI